MDYAKLVQMISVMKRESLSNRLADVILTSKNDEKMPSRLANSILHFWQQDMLKGESGLTPLLEAALLLEPEKTVNAFTELEMVDVAEHMKKTLSP